MPNWWLQWAERIAVILAEWWLRSRAGGAGEGPGTLPGDRPAEFGLDALAPSPPRPDADADTRLR